MSPRTTRWGKIATWRIALVGLAAVTTNRAVPRVPSVALVSWCTRVKEGVAVAHEAEGHVTAERLRSTTASVRHQFGNRWNMIP
jgi:hypothetical protein